MKGAKSMPPYDTLDGYELRAYFLKECFNALMNISQKSFDIRWFTNINDFIEQYMDKYYVQQNNGYHWIDIFHYTGDIIGFAVVMTDHGKYILEHVYVVPRFRHQGFAEYALDEFFNNQKSRITKVYAYTFTKNTRANRFLKKYFETMHGMIETPIKPTPYWIDEKEQKAICFNAEIE